MAAKSVAMEQLKQVLNLYRDGQSIKGIVRLTGLSRNTVRAYLAKLTEEVEHKPTQSDAALAGIFYNQDIAAYKSLRYQQLLAHFEDADRELSRPGVTRQLLWREYLDQHPDGYAYSQYCYHMHKFLGNKDVVMHLEYKPAEQIMVDFAGTKYHWVDEQTGERISSEVFVATLPSFHNILQALNLIPII
jgi:transposase